MSVNPVFLRVFPASGLRRSREGVVPPETLRLSAFAPLKEKGSRLFDAVIKPTHGVDDAARKYACISQDKEKQAVPFTEAWKKYSTWVGKNAVQIRYRSHTLEGRCVENDCQAAKDVNKNQDIEYKIPGVKRYDLEWVLKSWSFKRFGGSTPSIDRLAKIAGLGSTPAIMGKDIYKIFLSFLKQPSRQQLQSDKLGSLSDLKSMEKIQIVSSRSMEDRKKVLLSFSERERIIQERTEHLLEKKALEIYPKFYDKEKPGRAVAEAMKCGRKVVAVFADFEATGLRYNNKEFGVMTKEETDRFYDLNKGVDASGIPFITEVAARAYGTETSFSTYVNPGHPIPREAARVTDINDLTVRQSPSWSTVGKDFIDFLDRVTLFGSCPLLPVFHNGLCYDLALWKQENIRHGIPFDPRKHTLDTRYLFYRLIYQGDGRFQDLFDKKAPHMEPSVAMDKLRPIFGINNGIAHRAITDVKDLEDLFNKITEGLDDVGRQKIFEAAYKGRPYKGGKPDEGWGTGDAARIAMKLLGMEMKSKGKRRSSEPTKNQERSEKRRRIEELPDVELYERDLEESNLASWGGL